ncbi:MAG: 2-keto-4-pentenoate hydratase [Hyphomonadaceae bacterium]
MSVPQIAASAANIARSFVEARLQAVALGGYPGRVPGDLAEAYAIQDVAIGMWPDEISGWKIGMIAPEFRAAFGADRIAGPIFSRQVIEAASGAFAELPVIEGGFAAVEAEYLIRIGKNQAAAAKRYDDAAAAKMIGAVHIGVELAGSPFAGINDLGPAVTASDFGNNAGLVVGAPIPNWASYDWVSAPVKATIAGERVGAGTAEALPGGPLAALAFVLNLCAERGRPLRKGQWISSGAVTGVHRIAPGEEAELDFGGLGMLRCRAVASGARPPSAAAAG